VIACVVFALPEWRVVFVAKGVVSHLHVPEPLSIHLGCLLQVRGSIPLLWSQIPNIKYKPTTRLLASGSPTSAAFDAHFDGLLAKYKVGATPGSVVVILLHGSVAENVAGRASGRGSFCGGALSRV
jgi:hypothetical protein